jgi:hypothetical protein
MSSDRSIPELASRQSRRTNLAPGKAGWRIRRGREAHRQVNAFVTPSCVAPGDRLRVHLSSRAPGTLVQLGIFRLGGGPEGERRVYASQRLLAPWRGIWCPEDGALGGLRLDRAGPDWESLHAFQVPEDWRPGLYVVRAETADGLAVLVPFCISSPRPREASAVVVPTFSHQARNTWGGTGLGGPGMVGALRGLLSGRRVSLNRPSADPRGGEALRDVYPFLRWAEGRGLQADVLTDLDVHCRPERLRGYRRIILPGGGAFFSLALLDAFRDALAHGAQVLVLGAEVARFGVGLRLSGERAWIERLDPWAQRRFAVRAGEVFGFESGGRAERPGPLRFVTSRGDLLQGTGLEAGSQVPGLVGGELGVVRHGVAGVEILAEGAAPSGRGRARAQTAVQTLAGGGRLFLAGTSRWVAALDGAMPATGLQPDARVQALTAMLLGLSGAPHATAEATGAEARASALAVRVRHEPVLASLASVAGREDSLQQVVERLLPQVDVLRVYLNRYAEVPGFLRRARVEVCRSQEHGDRGDAGKFFWADDHSPGYRLTCDDDLVYPEDYVVRMLAAVERYDRRTVIGLHGVLLKQPLRGYYVPEDRGVLRFPVEQAADRCVHVLGTGTVAYHTSGIRLRRRDFQARNMADVWLAAQAQVQRVPLVAIARPRGWVRQSEHEQTERDSIYRHSAGRDGSIADTGSLQTQVLRTHAPLSIQAPRGPQGRRKLLLGVTTYNRRDYLQACLESFLATRNPAHEWVLVVADDGSQDDTLAYLESLPVAHELHFIRNQRRYAVGQTNTIFALSRKIGFDLGFKVDDDLIFKRPGWDDLYLEAIARSNFQHLCYLNHAHFIELQRRRTPGFRLPPEWLDSSGLCAAHVDVHRCMGALFTFTPEVLERVGDADEENFPIRGQWHIDYSARCCRAGFNQAEHFFDARDSNRFLALQNDLRPDYRCSIPWDEDYKRTKTPEELSRRQAVLADASRVRVAPTRRARPRPVKVDGFFERICVLNLDRRPDRLDRFRALMNRFEIPFTRFPAVDGGQEPHRSDWEAYARQPLASLVDGLRPVRSSREYYLDYDSELARVVFIEEKIGRKAIQSRGALGYLRSMEQLLVQAVEDDLESLLVLDDDVLLHRDFHARFERAVRQVPAGWKVLQLGTLQYHWEDGWIEWVTPELYRCCGSSTASHAVGMHRSAFPLLIDRCRQAQLPYDEGPLHTLKHLFPEDCYTLFPNLVIQDTSESDIGSSGTQAVEGLRRDNIFRWVLPDYLSGS